MYLEGRGRLQIKYFMSCIAGIEYNPSSPLLFTGNNKHLLQNYNIFTFRRKYELNSNKNSERC